jgi:type IV secretory pathway protease TraF
MQCNLQMSKQETWVNASQWGVFVVFILDILCVLLPKRRFIYINYTNSLPLGVYVLSNEKIGLGKYVIFSKPDNLNNIQRDWILGNASFLKQITAIPGDIVMDYRRYRQGACGEMHHIFSQRQGA